MAFFTKAIIAGTFLPAMIPIHTSTPIRTGNPTIDWHRCHPIIPPVPPSATQYKSITQFRLNAEKKPIQAGMMRQPEDKPHFLKKLQKLIQSEKTKLATSYPHHNRINTQHTLRPQTEEELLTLYTPDATPSIFWKQNPELFLNETINTKNETINAKIDAFPAKSTEALLEKTLMILSEAHDILCHLKNSPRCEEEMAFMRDITNRFVNAQANIIHLAHNYACDYWLPTFIQSITPKQMNQLFEVASYDEDAAHWVSQFLVAIAYLSNSEFSDLSTHFLNKALASGAMLSPIYQTPSEGKPPPTANLGYLLYAHNHVMLSLAGTQPCTMSQNLVAHLQFWKGNNDLHQGYHQYTETMIKPSIQPILNQLISALADISHYHDAPPLRISYAGHSLGASVAAILAIEEWLAKEMNITPEQQTLHINSAARIGGYQAHAQLQKNQIRLYSSTNEHDLVFKFPPQFIGFVPLTDIQPTEPPNIWHELQHQASALYQNIGEAFVRHELTTTLFIAPPTAIVQLQEQMGLWTLPPTIPTSDLLGYRTKV